MSTTKEKYLLGQHLVLLSNRALFWKEEKLLIVADPHFGKAQIFRDKGIPIPKGTTAGDLNRLSYLIGQFQPTGLLFLGDLVHGRVNNTLRFNRMIAQWRRRHSGVQFTLVTGNHDLQSGGPPVQFGFDQVAAKIILDPFIFTHKPIPDNRFYGIAGHLHPAVTVTGKGGLKETLPCFCFQPQSALLPAFGVFTGNQVIRPSPDDRIYIIAEDEVIEF